MRRGALLALIAAALLAAGCGSDSNDTEQPASAPASTPQATPTAAADLKDLSTKPTVAKPTGPPPTKLVVNDIVRGKGKRAKPGDTVSVQYVGVAHSTGQQFDASWDRGGEPFSFQLGSGQVIPGWDQGLVGMRAGGRRELIIPPDLAYGGTGSPPAIGPNETLIFIVDMEEIG